MNITDYLQTQPDDVIARVCEVEPRTAASWRRGERFPRREKLLRLIEHSGGQLTLEEAMQYPADTAPTVARA